MALDNLSVQRLYVAYFGRPADPMGLNAFIGQADATAINAFLSSNEYAQQYANASVSNLVNMLYRNLFGRDAEPAGLSYWSNKFSSGELTMANAPMTILASAGADDVTALNNRLSVAKAFTDAVDTAAEISGFAGTAAASIAHAFLDTVNKSDSSVATALAALNQKVADATGVPVATAPVTPPYTPPAAPTPISGNATDLLANIGAITPGTNITVTSALTLAQLALLDAANGNGLLQYSTVSGSPADLATNANGYVKAGINVVVSDSAIAPSTLAQLNAIDTANGAGTLSYTYVSDTTAHLSADAGTYVHGTTRVTVSDSGSIAQYNALLGTLHSFTTTFNAVSDTALNLITDINNSGFWVSSGMNVTVIDSVSLAQLQTIDVKNTNGSLTYAGLIDTAANLVANTFGYVKAGIPVTVTGSTTLEQLNTIDASNGSAAVTFGTVSYEAASAPASLAGFVSGINKFDYNQTVLAHGTGTSADGIVAAETSSGATISAAIALNNTNSLVYIAQTAVSNSAGGTAITALAANYSSAAATTLISTLVTTGGALSGTISGLDAGAGSGSTLWVLSSATDTIVLRVTDADTAVADTLTAAEVQVIGVFSGTSHLAAGDFI